MTRSCAIILAAGEGRRMGGDKALLSLSGVPLVSRVIADCRLAGVDSIVVVRRQDAEPLPEGLQGISVAAVAPGGEMIDSLRAGVRSLPEDVEQVIHFPVDYAMAGAATVALLLARLAAGDAGIVLPIAQTRPGHPIGFRRPVLMEILDPGIATLRDVIGRDPARVEGAAVHNDWVLRDLDTPADHRAAEAALRGSAPTVTSLMRAHRSRRSYHPDPIPDSQLEWLVDSARHAPTSSFIQAYSIVTVQDLDKKAAVARLCGDQKQIHEAPVFLAICADLHKLKLSCERHGMDLRAHSLEIFLQASIDAALVGQNLQLAAESEGLGSCMLGAARNHPVELARLLDLPRHAFVVFGMVLGRPKDDPVSRGRMPLAGVLHRESYKAGDLGAVLTDMDEGMRGWARRINARGGYMGRPVNEEKGWTDRMAWLWGRDREFRTHLAQQLEELGFGPF